VLSTVLFPLLRDVQVNQEALEDGVGAGGVDTDEHGSNNETNHEDHKEWGNELWGLFSDRFPVVDHDKTNACC